VLREAPVAFETWETPPRPTALASAAKYKRRCFSPRAGPRISKRVLIDVSTIVNCLASEVAAVTLSGMIRNCAAFTFWSFLVFGLSVTAADWPQWLGEKHDGVWRESGILEKFPAGGPEVVWKQAIGSGYSGPAVADGRVFVSDRVLAEKATGNSDPFERGLIPGQERLHCFDMKTGDKIWSHAYDCSYTVSYAAGPRATPAVAGDYVYMLGAEGNLNCLRVASGEVVWKKDLKIDFATKTPVWGFSASPLIEEDLLICLVGGEGSVAVAFDRNSGEEKWRALTAKEPGYAPPTIIDYGGHRQLLIWHPEAVSALEPATGKLLWSIPWQLRSGLSVPTPRQQGDRLFFTCFYNGSLMLKLKEDGTTPEVQWQTERESERRTTHLNSIMSSPYLSGDHIFGVCSYGEFRCLDAKTGDRVWESMKVTTGDNKEKERWANVFLTPHEPSGRWFLFNESGDLVIAKLSPTGFEEIDRANVIEPNGIDMQRRKIVWSHPAYANKCVFVRNDSEIRCISLAE
jgi:outer membrane protein assembly factor BamB